MHRVGSRSIGVPQRELCSQGRALRPVHTQTENACVLTQTTFVSKRAVLSVQIGRVERLRSSPRLGSERRYQRLRSLENTLSYQYVR